MRSDWINGSCSSEPRSQFGDFVCAGIEVSRQLRHVETGVIAARPAALERYRAHQGGARGWLTFQARQHPGQNVEIARATDPSARSIDDLDRGIGGRADDRGKHARDRGCALELLARVMNGSGAVAARLREFVRSRPQRPNQRVSAMRGPTRTERGHRFGDCKARARSRSTNFCTLPVDVLGISAKTMCRGHLYRASRSRHHCEQFVFADLMAGLQLDEGAGRLAPFFVGEATTAASCTAGCWNNASSTSIEEISRRRR